MNMTFENEDITKTVNFIIMEAKYCIWKNRNNVKYGKKICKNTSSLLIDLNQKCKQKLESIKTVYKCSKKHSSIMDF